MVHIKVTRDFLYLYAIILATELEEIEFPQLKGIDEKVASYVIHKDLAAIVTPVNSPDYSQAQIDLQLKNIDWLQEKAFHHHECISAIHKYFTVLPINFCTIFQNKQNLESLLTEQYDELLKKLTFLKDKQEWNLKVFCKVDKALDYVTSSNTTVTELKEKIETMPKGKQFLMKKKLQQLITSEFEKEQGQWLYQIRHQLEPFVVDSVLRKNWGKDVTKREDDMIGNVDFLLEGDRSEVFLHEIQEIEKSFEAYGCTCKVTGPWPPYHFSKMQMVNE